MSFFVPVSKPRPPINLSYGSKNRSDDNYRIYFGLNMYPPHNYRQSTGLTYKVKVKVHRVPDPQYQEYECDNSTVMGELAAALDVPVQKYVDNSNEHVVYMQAATVFRGVDSDYTWFFDQSTNDCEIPVVLGEWLVGLAPPPTPWPYFRGHA